MHSSISTRRLTSSPARPATFGPRSQDGTREVRRRGARSLVRRLRSLPEAGMTTAEYAVGTIAACAFAAVLLAIVKSDGIGALVLDVITTALSVVL